MIVKKGTKLNAFIFIKERIKSSLKNSTFEIFVQKIRANKIYFSPGQTRFTPKTRKLKLDIFESSPLKDGEPK